MPYLSVTRLKLKSRRMVPGFLKAIQPTFDQVVRSPGYLDGKALVDFSGGAWTMTLWTDQESMRKFYLSGAHRALMPRLDEFSCEACNRGAPTDNEGLLSWREARNFLAEGAKYQHVAQPSLHHMEQYIPTLWFPLLSQRLKKQADRVNYGVQA